jgi:hypothetical protein
MIRFRVLIAFFLLGSTSFCQTAPTSATSPPSISALERAQYRLEANIGITFPSSKS